MSFIDNISKTVRKVGDVVKKTYGPLDVLNSDFSSLGTQYRYPNDVGDSSRYPHTVEFQTWIPVTRPISQVGLFKPVAQGLDKIASGIGGLVQGGLDTVQGAINKVGDKLGAAGNLLDDRLAGIEIKAERILNNGSGEVMQVEMNQRWNDRMFDWQRRAEKSDLIAMYMPSGGWMDRVTNSYEQTSMTSAMGNAGFVLEAGGSVIQQFVEEDGAAAWAQAKEMINGPAGAEALGKASGKLGMDAGIMTSAGLYSGTDLREFQFDFTMTPRDQKEAETIKKIIRRFKYHASPAYVSGQGRYIIPPSYFDIVFKFNGEESKWLPRISTCVLKSFDVDYTGGLEQWSTHADGSPIQVKMTMIFQELEMMHKSLRKKGY
jgi:hypothetical protein